MADSVSNRESVVISYEVESVTNVLLCLRIYNSGRVEAQQTDDVSEKGKSGESRIEQSRVKTLAEKLLEAMKGIEDCCAWDEDEEDRHSIIVDYGGWGKKAQWVWNPPQHNTPEQIKSLVGELETVYNSVTLDRVI